jgi:hypothetical protein
MATSPPTSQQQIEARAAAMAGVTPGPDQTMRDVYGEMEQWSFQLGPWEFLLDPVTRRWFVLDFAHNQYLETGYGAGEAVFELVEGVGFTPPPLRPDRAPPPAPVPTPAAVPTVGFCAKCGAAVEPGWKFCVKCKSPVAAADIE